MKIAYLFSRYPVPSQTFCDTEIRALEAAGHEIEIYSCSAPTTSFRHGRPGEWPRAKVHYAPPASVLQAWEQAARADGTWPEVMVEEHVARFGPRYDPARRARHALYFANLLRRRGVEHLHVHFANRATHAALFIQALTGIAFSFTAHAQDFLVDLGNDDLLRLMCERAAFVVTVSDWSRGALLERCPAAAPKVHRIYNGLALEQWPTPLNFEPEFSGDTSLRILSVGRLIEFKGFQDLIAACRLLRDRKVPFSCEIVGEGPLREELERQAAEFTEPHARMSLTGLLPQAEVRTRLRRCNVFVLASRTDGKGACDVLPTVILEAMATAKVVVSTRLAGIPEMIELDRTGLLVPPGEPVMLANALAQLASSALEGAKMGQAGRRKFEQQFTAAESARKLSGLFAEAVAGSAFVPAQREVFESNRSVFCLFDQWPVGSPTKGQFVDGKTLLKISRALPGFAALALKPATFSGTSAKDTQAGAPCAESLHLCGFLPDAVVFETYWRNFLAETYRLEEWRGDVGSGYDIDEFLSVCRVALYLQHAVLAGRGRGKHLHAVGRLSVLCAWLLRRLEAVESASFLLFAEADGGMRTTGSTLRKLASVFSGGWLVDERKLAASLGANFVGGPFDAQAWMDEVATYAAQAAGKTVAD